MKLSELDTLNLADNKIEKLPNKLYKITPKLKTFLMTNNNLRDIPSDICLIKSLSNINFYGNQIRRLRADALTSATALLNYYRKIHVFDEEDKINDNNNFSNNNNSQKNQINNNNINNNIGPNNSRQKSGYKNMDQPNYHNTHGYNNQNQINNSYGNNNYIRGYNNQTNNNNYNNIFGGQFNQNNINNNFNNNQYNYNQNNYGQNNMQNNMQFNNNDSSSGNSNKRTLDDINKDIASLEEEMSIPTLPQYQKAALRKKYHSLLVERSKHLK